MDVNFKPGSRVRHRYGKHETGVIMKPIGWNWRYLTAVVRVRLDREFGGGVQIFRIGQLRIIKEEHLL